MQLVASAQSSLVAAMQGLSAWAVHCASTMQAADPSQSSSLLATQVPSRLCDVLRGGRVRSRWRPRSGALPLLLSDACPVKQPVTNFGPHALTRRDLVGRKGEGAAELLPVGTLRSDQDPVGFGEREEQA